MTQTQIEKLDQHEYCHLLSYGDPDCPDNSEYAKSASIDMYDLDDLDENDFQAEWISTLDSTTYLGMTFGYSVAPYMYTSL